MSLFSQKLLWAKTWSNCKEKWGRGREERGRGERKGEGERGRKKVGERREENVLGVDRVKEWERYGSGMGGECVRG